MLIDQHQAYFFALVSATLFSGASVLFADLSSRYSSLWMNLMKNLVAGACFCVVSLGILLFRDAPALSFTAITFLFASGFIGLAVGDFFLFRGYQRIGSARTLMVFSFSPLFLTIEGYLFFGQSLSQRQFGALVLMMACVWTLSFEKFRSQGKWEWLGFVYAMLGVLLDNLGIVLSRKAFDISPELGTFEANAIRTVGAVLPLLVVLTARPGGVIAFIKKASPIDRRRAVGASFVGTFLSLTFWLMALKVGHIGGLAAVGSFNPVAASLWEWWLLRKRPTVYLLVAFSFFIAGFSLLVL